MLCCRAETLQGTIGLSCRALLWSDSNAKGTAGLLAPDLRRSFWFTQPARSDGRLLWTKYIQLTEAETVFRALKSALLIQPLFHQLEPRVKAHILVAFLGYAMWVTLKHLLRQAQSDLSPAQALALLSTLQSADIVLPTTDGREIRLRRIATPDPHQQKLLAQLGLVLPDHFNLNLQCSADSAIA
jgi:hypothetical protein